ncbi:hypothetical protein C2S52_022622 [Perilla frutescens var. hirtella]|nr:hypothetical protein C2S52_022622 [Perilla frutescens var. hirtella]KAH6807007.1 hypothetical protein C2S51_028115 [Perilla frutescens var. frutescens]
MTMLMMCISHRSVVLVLICVGLLALHPQQAVCGRLLLRRGVDDHHAMILIKNHRVLMAAHTSTLATGKKPAARVVDSTTILDPNHSSKRKVRRGSDPIHNRT